MGWTANQGRRRDRLRRRPHLEHLDDRCLLSTGLEGNLIHATPTLRERASGAIREAHHEGTPGKGSGLVVRHHGRADARREKLAGTLTATTSAGAPYDTIIGASQVQSNYNVNGSGMTVAVIDTGVDYNNPAPGRWLRARREGHRRIRFRRQLVQSDGRLLAARHGRRWDHRLG